MEASLKWKPRLSIIHADFYTPLENQSSRSDHRPCHLVILHCKQSLCHSLILIFIWHQIFKHILSYLTLPSYHMSFCHFQVRDPSSHMGWHTSRVHSPVDNSIADNNIYLTSGRRIGHPLIVCSLKDHRRMQLNKTWQSGISLWKRFGFHKPVS